MINGEYAKVLSHPSDRTELPDDPDCFEKAAVLIDDAIRGKFIERDLDSKHALVAYQLLKKLRPYRILSAVIYLLLAFIEVPSWCLTDGNCGSPNEVLIMGLPVLPRLATEITETVLLLFFIVLVALRAVAIGRSDFLKMNHFVELWQVVFVLLAFVDVAVGSINVVGIIPGSFRLCRWLRPAVVVSMTPRLRRVIRNVSYIVIRIADLVALLAIIVGFAAWFAILVFTPDTAEGKAYFSDYVEALTSLFIAATTSNHPDVMLRAYTENRVSLFFFVTYMSLATFLTMNLLLAAVYDSYRNAMKDTLKELLISRKSGIKAAFHLLDHNSTGFLDYEDWEAVYDHLRPDDSAHAKMLFDVLDTDRNNVISEEEFVTVCSVLALTKKSRRMNEVGGMPGRSGSLMMMRTRTMSAIRTVKYSWVWQVLIRTVNSIVFEYTIDAVIVLNTIFMIIETAYDFKDGSETHLWLEGSEIVFTLLYTIEMTLKHMVWGFKKYWKSLHNVFDGVVTIVALVTEVLIWIPNEFTDSRVVRVILVTRMLRLIRLLARRQNFRVLFGVIVKLVPAIINTLAIMGAFFYLFAIVGVQLFGGLLYIGNPLLDGTDYATEAGGYFALNFNDFGSALMTLYSLLIVNNWFVIMDGTAAATATKWTRLFFVLFYFICVVIIMNLLISYVLEHFIVQWERFKSEDAKNEEAPVQAVTEREKLLLDLFGHDFLVDDDEKEEGEE